MLRGGEFEGRADAAGAELPRLLLLPAGVLAEPRVRVPRWPGCTEPRAEPASAEAFDPEDPADRSDYPEAEGDLRLGPAESLEVMVDRSE